MRRDQVRRGLHLALENRRRSRQSHHHPPLRSRRSHRRLRFQQNPPHLMLCFVQCDSDARGYLNEAEDLNWSIVPEFF